jgi:3-hydroxyacyl-CoA dehydrogenase
MSTQSAAQHHLFLAERETVRIPDIGNDVRSLPVASVGVIGAGTMGGGIAMNFLNAGIPVTLVEMNDAALRRGLATMSTVFGPGALSRRSFW